MVHSMSEEHRPTPEETPAPPFHWNPKVLQMAALVMLALALPLTIAIYGIRDIRKASQPATEAEGLRSVLENVVDQKWQSPVLAGAVRTTARVVPNGDACLEVGNDIQNLARDSGGSLLAPERIETGGTRWLVQIPADRLAPFESSLAERGFSPVLGEAQGDPVIYSIEIRIAP